MDTLDKQFKIKQFLMTVYEDAITNGNNLNDGEYIRVYQNNKRNQMSFDEFSKVEFFNNIDDVVSHCTKKNVYNLNTYFTLATTDGASGQLDSLKNRYCIAFDFDKKDYEDGLTIADIINKFNNIGLKYHALIDSGNGYHAYIMINKTSDIKLVEKVTKTIANKLGADINACKTTQVLRIPYTWNIKDKKKQVRIIKLYDKHTIKRYDVEDLAKRFCRDVKPTKDTNIKYILDTRVPGCIAEILKDGSKDGNKNKDLQKIVISLRLRNKTLPQVMEISKEWNYKSEKGYSENELEYQVQYMYDNLRSVDFGCKSCKSTNECWSNIESDFVYTENDILINVPHKHMKDLKYKNRKGAKVMKGNQLFIYNVLLNNKDRELNVDEITELITYKRRNKVKNIAMSEKTLRDTLKELLEHDYISVVKGNARAGVKDKYKVNTVRCKVDKEYTISYFATLAVIWGVISTEDLRLYAYMRYKQDLLVKEGKAKGNILRINQEELAKDLGVTQQRISDMIDGLLESKILDIWETKVNDNGFMYYTYRLNK
ncbi:hypothetical protein UT300009_34670 [Paraclostridium bifermentans]